MEQPAPRLWRHRNFLLLWSGQSISQIGSAVTVWALPLTAVFALRASVTQVGLLTAASSVPYVLAGLLAGAWVDRVRRRPLLVAADVGRAALLLSIPLAAMLGRLSIGQLYVVAFANGLLRVLFDVAYTSFLPSVVAPNQLLEGNSKLEASGAVANIAGPGLAGVLVQLFTGPIALLGDALSYVASFVSLAFMYVHESPARSEREARAWLGEVWSGIGVVIRHPLLRALAIGNGLFGFFDTMLIAIYVPYLVRSLAVPSAGIGIIFTVAGLGGLLGAGAAERIARRAGIGRTILGGMLVAGLAEVLIALAQGPIALASVLVIAGEAGVQGGDVVSSIVGRSLQQRIVPDWLRGRVSATTRVISSGLAPLGAIVGGWSGDHVGLRPTVVVAGLGTLLAFGWVWRSPVRRIQVLEQSPSEAHVG
jgi:MFS family permease